MDLSIFRTENRRGRSHDDPPAYSFHDSPADSWEANHWYPDSRTNRNADYFLPDIHAGNQIQRQSRDEFTVPEAYREDTRYTRSEPSWRDTDLSYFDKYLERSGNTEVRNQVDYSVFSTSRDYLPTKEDAQYEELRVSTQPDFTAEVSYRGQTSHQPTQYPVLEQTDSSAFHFMAQNNAP